MKPTGPASGSQARRPRPARRRRFWRAALLVVVFAALALTAARAALPSYLRSYVNRVLDQSPDYDGDIGPIEVSLWRGAYTINDIRIVKRERSIPVPFFESRQLDLSLDWSALFHGQARGKVIMQSPRINFVLGPTTEDSQTGAAQPWLSMLDDLFPFRIDKAEIADGEVHFQAFHTRPPVDMELSEVKAVIANLTNVANSTEPLIASVHARGTAVNSGHFRFDMNLDPQSHLPNFEMAVRLVDVDATKLNAMTRAFAHFDFESGRFDFVTELAARDGVVQGYAKPLFRGVQIVGPRDIQKGPPGLVWEMLVGIAETVFKNQPRDQFGTRVTLEGELDNPSMNLLEVVGNVLRNAFVQAYLPRVEGRVAPGLRTRGPIAPEEEMPNEPAKIP